MTQFIWKDNGSVGWDGTFGQQDPAPVVEGEDSPRIFLDCYVGSQKIGSIEALSSHYSIGHETEWGTEARSIFRKTKKFFSHDTNSRLQEMKDWVEGEFEKFRKATGL